jgi:hypothetical protein
MPTALRGGMEIRGWLCPFCLPILPVCGISWAMSGAGYPPQSIVARRDVGVPKRALSRNRDQLVSYRPVVDDRAPSSDRMGSDSRVVITIGAAVDIKDGNDEECVT